MTQLDRHVRPSATQAMEHEWFESSNDTELPDTTVCGLLGTSLAHCVREKVIDQLGKENNLHELRTLHGKFQEMDTSGRGALPGEHVVDLMQEHGTARATAVRYAEAHAREDGMVDYHHLMKESVGLKEQYSDQFIKDLFDELDSDGSGLISASELQVLLESDAFECPEEDIEDLMEQMDFDSDDLVSFAEFRRAVLEDGRIGRRANQTVSQAHHPCCFCS